MTKEKARSCLSIILISVILLISCKNEAPEIQNDDNSDEPVVIEVLPVRSGTRPETTTGIPHKQVGVKPVPDVHERMVRRIYAIQGIEDRPSVIGLWRGLWSSEDLTIDVPDALIGGREFAHIHDDGSLHIFLEPERAKEAVDTGWAIYHPFAVQGLEGWDGFVMLYTPQSFEELDVTFQLIVDGYNYVTGQ